MKKVSSAIAFPLLILVSLATVTGLAGNIETPWGRSNLIGLASAQTRSTSITVSLPNLAAIHLKDGTKPSGRVMEIDSQTQELKLQRGNASRLYSFDAIEKVVYRQDADFYATVRARKKPVSNQSIFRSLSVLATGINNF